MAADDMPHAPAARQVPLGALAAKLAHGADLSAADVHTLLDVLAAVARPRPDPAALTAARAALEDNAQVYGPLDPAHFHLPLMLRDLQAILGAGFLYARAWDEVLELLGQVDTMTVDFYGPGSPIRQARLDVTAWLRTALGLPPT